MERPLILLTNDDGIESPGLAAAAAALDPLGELLIVAPSTQQSGMGRSMPIYFDGRISETTVRFGKHTWQAYSANASPALAVQHAVLELAPRPVALAVSGINYGANVGLGITISGTVGAALEAAALGIPALAVSLEADPRYYLEYDYSADFDAAIHFARRFAARWLSAARPAEVDVLKIEIPAQATPETPWRVTRLERGAYYVPVPSGRQRLEDAGPIGFTINQHVELDSESDAGALQQGLVAVTPLRLDMTALIAPDKLRRVLSEGA